MFILQSYLKLDTAGISDNISRGLRIKLQISSGSLKFTNFPIKISVGKPSTELFSSSFEFEIRNFSTLCFHMHIIKLYLVLWNKNVRIDFFNLDI